MSCMKSLNYKGLKGKNKGLLSKDPEISVLNKTVESFEQLDFTNVETEIQVSLE